MDNEQEANKLVFTNEKWVGQGCRKGKCVAIVFIVSGVIVMILPGPLGLLGPSMPPNEQMRMVLGCLFMGTLALCTGIGLWRGAVFRTWNVYSEGLEFHDSHGQTKIMPWHRVERVRWDPSGICFQSQQKRLRMPWKVIPRSQERPVKQKIAELLPAFNLPVGGNRRVRYLLITLSILILYIIVFLATGLFVVIELGSVMRHLKWGGMLSEDFLKLIWVLLTASILTPIRLLTEPMYWHDRQFSDFSKIGTSEV